MFHAHKSAKTARIVMRIVVTDIIGTTIKSKFLNLRVCLLEGDCTIAGDEGILVFFG